VINLEENQEVQTNNNNQNKTNPMLIVGIVVAVLAIGAVVVLGMGARNTGDDSTTSMAETTATPLATPSSMDQVESDTLLTSIIEVEGGSFYYKPNEITTKRGEEVTILLNSVDMMHDFVIDELNVKSEIAKAGSSTRVTFTPNEVGEFEFYCSVGNHRAMGMVGTLIVTQ
jgi:heme/copper-type cytochrome/quinol oxidase subunit 2